VTAAAAKQKVFRRLIEAEKRHGLPLVTEVKPDNKSDMAARLTRYHFQRYFSSTSTAISGGTQSEEQVAGNEARVQAHIPAMLVMFSLAAPVAAGPRQDPMAAYGRGDDVRPLPSRATLQLNITLTPCTTTAASNHDDSSCSLRTVPARIYQAAL